MTKTPRKPAVKMADSTALPKTADPATATPAVQAAGTIEQPATIVTDPAPNPPPEGALNAGVEGQTAISENIPPSEPQSGVGDPASPAGGAFDREINAFAAAYPLLAAAMQRWAGDNIPTVVRITSKVEGFRRAGIAHSKTPVDHDLQVIAQTMTPESFETLLTEPNLVVEFI